MSDDSFIREVDEEMRSDQLQQLWDRYKMLVIGGAVAIVAVTAGYRGWDYYTTSIAAASGDRFMSAITLSNDGKHDEAIKILQELSGSGSGQYPALANMRIASEYAARGDEKLAIESYDKIAGTSTSSLPMKLIAQLRAGLLAIDNNDLADVTRRLLPLAGPGLPFRHLAREGLGLAAFKAGKKAEALKWFDAIVNDAESGTNVRGRANVMLELLAGQGITKSIAGS